MKVKFISKLCESFASKCSKNGLSVVQNNIVAKNPINLNADPKSLMGASAIKIPAWKKLVPKKFSTTTPENRVLSIEFSDFPQFKYIKKVDGVKYPIFKEELSPKNLEIEKDIVLGADLDNLVFPNGSIALASKLNETISTSGMWQCCAVSFVNKKDDTQALLHLCPMVHKPDNESLIEYIMKNIPQNGLEIGVVSGSDTYSDETISFFVDTVKKINPHAKIDFYDFPDGYDRVVLRNGELKCIDFDSFIEDVTNPEDRIIYAS